MKTDFDMGYIVECLIKHELEEKDIRNYISHWDCQDTEGDGEVECYFYFKEDDVNRIGIDNINSSVAYMLGLPKTNMIELPDDDGHKGEYRLEYIFSLKSE